MSAHAHLLRLRQFFRRCSSDRSGNVTTVFALATVPLVGFIGAAVDYSHANAVKIAMQAAVNSTALMLSKEASSLNSTQMQTKASGYFQALYTRSDSSTPVVSVTYTTSGGSQIVIGATTSMKTNFMGIMGFSSLKTSANARVKWGDTKLRIALALDNTG